MTITFGAILAKIMLHNYTCVKFFDTPVITNEEERHMNKPFFPTANHVHCLRTDERILGGRLFALLLCLSALLSLAAGTAAADCPNAVTVTTAADGGAGSLRQAIADVCTGGIITFKGAYTIRLAAPLTIDRDVTIDGADHTVISGDTDGNGVGDQSLVMVGNLDNTVNPTATLKNLTLTSGIAVSFAPIMNFSTLTLDHVHVLNNLVPTISTFNRGTLNVVDSDFSNTLTGYSDGIFNIGVLNVTRATFSGNAGAIDNNSYGNSFSPRATIIDSAFVNNTGTLSPGFYGGGIIYNSNQGTLTVSGSTFNGNTASPQGVIRNDTGGTLVVTNSTFSGNLLPALDEYGFGVVTIRNTGNMTLTNTTFADNRGVKDAINLSSFPPPASGDIVRFFNNVFVKAADEAACAHDVYISTPQESSNNLFTGYCGKDFPTPTGFTLKTAAEINLGELGNYGGLTQTIPLLAGSAGIDAGNAGACPATDQRGFSRAGTCDIGAYEYNYTGIYYVKQGGSGAEDCRSWENACDLQTALRSAHSGDEVWVAAGVYKPTADTSKRDATFQLVSGVGVYGGFSGGESTRTARNPKTHQVVLSGDIDNNDTQTPVITDVDAETSNNGNSYHVVNGASGATLDGVTITAGYLHGAHYSGVGAGMTNNSTMKIANVIFIGNSADGGGGLYNNGGSPELKDVTFRRNEAFNNGGGMLVTAGSPVLMGVTFSGNISKIKGGGMVNWVNGKAVLTNVTFSGNTAGESGGGMYNYGSSPALTNVAFNLNTALKGGGMFNDNGSNPTIGNNIFWGDTGGEIYNGDLDSAPLVSDSVVQGGYTGGTHIITTDPLLGALGDYGGLTQTIPLLPGSAAINAGNTGACPARDQRGKNRVGGCDIGAFESQGFTLTKTGDDQSAVINTPFAAPLAVIVSSAYGEPVNGGVVAFAAGSSPEGASAQLSGGSVLISGGAAGVTATANGAAGTYDVMTSTVGASAAKFSLTNSRIATTTVLVSSANPALLGNAITFTATVSPAPDGGTVEFRDGSSVIIGCAAQPVSLGQAVCGASSLSLGTHGITAFYSGSPNYLAGDNSATPLQQQVNQPAYTVTAVVGEHGALDPTTPSPASVTSNQQTTFRFMADSGYHLTTVTGCGGTLSGDTYTTAPITGACAVTAAFAPDPANIGVTPSSPFDFGGVNVGASSAAQTFTIANSGNLQLNMGPITTDNTEFRISNNYCSSVAELPPGGACTLQVTFIPASGGQRSGALSIVSNDPDTSDFKVLLNGVGQAANIEVSPASPIAFGGVKVGASSTARTVTITNSGNLPLNIGQISTATTEFGLANDTCSNHPVAAGGACALDLTFSPTAIGSRSALLDIPSDDPDTPHAYISLNGLGQAAQINVTPSSPVIFGSVNAGAASAPLTFTITNSGNDELSIAGIVTSNPEFSVGNDTCSFRTVAVGAGCALDVTFAPTGNGDRTGNLRIPSNDPGGEAVVALSGTGIQYGLVVSGGGSTASGVVTGGSGINCGIAPQGVTSGTCMEPVNPGASVTLTATPQIGAGVTWSGCDSIPATPATSCTVNVTTATTVTATFTLNNYNLNVTRSGNGVVTSTPAGITRGGVCTMSYPYNTTVTLTAVPAVGFALSGWSGCDSASGNLCTVVMTGTRNVAAAFAPTASGVTVIAPNGGESVRAGNSLTIRWQVTGNPGGALRIELLKRGAVNQTISSGVPMSVGSYQWTVPVTQTAGNDYSVKITSAASASYKDSSDRAFSITAAPDLIISALTVPASAPPGQAITVSDTVNNNGPGVAPGSAIYYYLSTDSVWDAGDTYLGSRSIPSLAARAANSGCSVITLPSVMAAGTWYLIAKADGPGAIAETNEANNSLAKSFQSTPDLIVSALTGATSVKGGQSVSYSVTTKNQGTAVTPATTTSLYWTTKNTWDGRAVSLGSCAVASLAAGAAAMCPINVTIPAGTPGKYYVIAVSDVTAQVAEISETNNTANLKVTVAP